MNVSFRLCDVRDSSDIPVYSSVRVVWQNGTLAVWKENRDERSADRLARFDNVSYLRRTSAREPHIFTFEDMTFWRVYPRQSGGCCGGGTSNFSDSDLLREDLTHV